MKIRLFFFFFFCSLLLSYEHFVTILHSINDTNFMDDVKASLHSRELRKVYREEGTRVKLNVCLQEEEEMKMVKTMVKINLNRSLD